MLPLRPSPSFDSLRLPIRLEIFLTLGVLTASGSAMTILGSLGGAVFYSLNILKIN